jgi:hypothetical protein
MSISHVDSSHSLLPRDHQSRQRQHRVGEQVRLTVLQRLDETRYQVGFAEGWRVVSSTVALPVGATIRATVTAVGEKLELQYLGTDAVAAAMAEHEAKGEDALEAHEQRHRVFLNDADRLVLKQAMRGADDADGIMEAGLFLGKLSVPLDMPKLQAVYDSQRWAGAPTARDGAADLKSLQSSDGIDQLAAAVQQALQEPPGNVQAAVIGATSSDSADAATDDDAERDRQKLAWELLNDQDGGSVEYRYGVLPLIIADQLFELDLVYFRDRHAAADSAVASKRMVMTLNAPALGRVEVIAHAIGERVAITIKADSAASLQVLSGEEERVRELIGRLGWGVDAVRYHIDGVEARAAGHVVQHVLDGDSLSRWV